MEGLEISQAEAGFPCLATPDGYKYMLVDTDEGDANEPFLFVSLNVSDLAAAKKFYCDGLGAKVVAGGAGTLGTPNRCGRVFEGNRIGFRLGFRLGFRRVWLHPR